MKGSGTMQGAGPNPKTGHHSTHHSRHSIRPQGKRQGGTPTHGRGHRHSTGRPATQPPFTHDATHHPLCHPPSAMAPPSTTTRGRADRGYPTTRTAQTHAHHPHTTHLARNSARHDSSTRQHCNGTSRARAAPPHWAGQQHTHRHSTHRGGWTPSTHPLITLTHSRSHT